MIEIAFNIDEKYLDYCRFVIACILHNTKEKCRFHIVGVDGYESTEQIRFYPAPNTMGIKVESRHINDSALYRLFLPKILKDIDKVIYLDCDIVVRDDIKKLWKYNPKEIAGVLDPCEKTRITPNYINSGVMVMNLKALRENNFIERIVANRDKAHTLLADQDIINLAFDIENIPSKWNTPSRNYVGQPKSYYDKEHASIIHYTGPYKPWKYEVENAKYWKEYERLFNNRS